MRVWRGVCCGLIACASLACGEPASEGAPIGRASSAVSGGAAVPAGSWPLVGWLDNGCTGVLLAPKLLVTAAHCGGAAAFWLGDTFEVHVDDQAGTASAIDAPAGSMHRVVQCTPHPNGEIASGRDIAWCELAEPALDSRQIAPALLGCKREALTEGADVTLVGFGRDATNDAVGIKRSALATVTGIGTELEIGDAERGTCAGDSGSPAFVQLDSGTGSEWQIAGVLSNGLEGERCGVGYYTDLSAVLPWLEQSSGVALSPCGTSQGVWSPSVACQRAALDRDGEPTPTPTDTPSTACGAAYAAPESSGCALSTSRRSSSAHFLVVAVAALFAWRRRRYCPHASPHAATAQRM